MKSMKGEPGDMMGNESIIQDDGPTEVPVAPPCAMVIFGAAGDLTKRLVVPALYNLVQAGQLSQHFQLVGFDHNARSIQQWRKELTGAMEDFVGQGGEFHVDAIDHSAWSWLTERMSYVQG